MVLDEICVAPTGRLSIIPSLPNTMLSTGIIVRQHGNHGIAAAGVRRAGDSLRALCDEFVSFRPRPVVHAHLMAGLQEPCRHPGAHMAQSNETYLHEDHSFCCAPVFSRLSLPRYVRARRRSRIR